jgi:hypothetical protein
LHQFGGNIKVQHGRHPLVELERFGEFAGFHQVIQRNGLTWEGASHASQ